MGPVCPSWNCWVISPCPLTWPTRLLLYFPQGATGRHDGWKMGWKVLESRKILNTDCRNLCSGAWSTSLPPSLPPSPSLVVCRAVSLTLLLSNTPAGLFSAFKICYLRGVAAIPDGLNLGQLQIHPGANSHCPCWTLGKLLAAPHIKHPRSLSLPKICCANPISLVSQKASATGTPWASVQIRTFQNLQEAFLNLIIVCFC